MLTYRFGTIMSINEDPSLNLIGRQVDNSVLAVHINDIFRCTAAYLLVDLSTCRPSAIVIKKDPV